MNTTPDHPDFTALALGEHILGTPSRAVTEALRSSVAARREAEHIRSAGTRLSAVLKSQPALRLDSARRHAILRPDLAAARARFAAEEAADLAGIPFAPPATPAPRRRAAWLLPAAAAAVLATGAFVYFRPDRTAPAIAATPAAPAEKPAPDLITIKPAAPATTPGRRDSAPVAPPPHIVESTTPALAPVPVPPAEPAPPVIVQQPALPKASDPAVAPAAPGTPVPDFATPQKRRRQP